MRAGPQLSICLARSRMICSQSPRRKLTTSIAPSLAQLMFKTLAPPRVSSHTSRFVPRAKGPIEYRTVPRSTSVSSWPPIEPGLPCLAANMIAAAFSSGICTQRFVRMPVTRTLLYKPHAHQPADAILVDLDRLARDPWIDPEFDIADAFVERAMGADVATVVIGGILSSTILELLILPVLLWWIVGRSPPDSDPVLDAEV